MYVSSTGTHTIGAVNIARQSQEAARTQVQLQVQCRQNVNRNIIIIIIEWRVLDWT